ncbi:MAG: tryptophan synthase subunit alpha [Candidatus Tectomicrobia bacterium]|uniref:Tryptophan synthase alpha chain n=1 Tax=Tectimicrobiota bacterium TaxID=2528274 RepID=A0A932G1U1_UNCTE|nr:tryptophan synthase subunit alpha [Candidatus Tectomicrobia bacterium]
MRRIEARFRQLRGRKEAALIPFMAAGDPSLAATRELILELAQSGADLIELGVPFSDPLADGPVIQLAYQRALGNRVGLCEILQLVEAVRPQTEVPLILMSYYNPIHRWGEADFVRQAAQAGVDGLILPDLPPEEGKGLQEAAAAAGLATILLIAPTSSRERIRRIAEVGTGFLYYVSLMGVTGTRDQLSADLEGALGAIRELTDKPIAAGFGISTPQQVAEAAAWADGVIVGSALVRIIQQYGSSTALREQVGAFVRQLKSATIAPGG